MRQSPIYIFAGGGTGGHLYPGLAVAEELAKLDPAARIVFACSNRLIDRKILNSYPYAIVPQPVRPIPRGMKGWIGFLGSLRASAAQSRQMVADLKPAAVLGLGGFAAGPMVRRAAKVGIPTALLNPDGVPGAANKLLSRHVDAIFTQFESAGACFCSSARKKVLVAGCPIRTSLLAASRAEAVNFFELKPDRKTLLVFGASLGAASINDAFVQLAADLEPFGDAWQIMFITGTGKGEALAGAYRDRGIFARGLEYCDRMDLAYAVSDLAVCRSGASTVAELSATGTPAVLLPYPYHKDQQQKLNAADMAAAGAAIICDDAKDPSVNAIKLRQILLGLLKDEARLANMKSAAAGIGKPYAAREVANWLVASGNGT